MILDGIVVKALELEKEKDFRLVLYWNCAEQYIQVMATWIGDKGGKSPWLMKSNLELLCLIDINIREKDRS